MYMSDITAELDAARGTIRELTSALLVTAICMGL
jgi:hypothetical protein